MIISDEFKKQIEKIWQQPDFSLLFKEHKKTSHKIRKDTIIFNEGDPLGRLYLIIDGFVKLYRLSPEGKETTIYLYGPGEVLGVRALLSEDECAKHNAEALTDVKVLTISRKDYFENTLSHPEFLLDLIHIFVHRLNYTERRLEGFILTDTTSRVASFLCDCAHRFGKKKNSHIIIPVPLTHQRIAEFVGSIRETVTGSINHLEKEGILKNDRGKITILDIKKLQKLAQSEPGL